MPAHARRRVRHRKPLDAKRARLVRRYSAMAAVAVVGGGVMAITPVAPPEPVPELGVASADVRLAAATGSILNVPMNLAIDLVNVPSNEVKALDFLSKSLFFSGAWFVVSATNLWGVDPGDPSHFQSVVQLAVPFPALSGLGLDQSDQNGLGQQVWHTVAVVLPISTYCDAAMCTPVTPTSPITGITSTDFYIWTLALLTGQVKFPLIDNWLNPERLTQLLSGGYTFDSTYPGYADPSGPVKPLFDFPGTTVGPDGENLNPWADTTFTLNLLKPLQNYFNHLMADPSTNPIQLPDLVQFGRTLQAVLASMVVAFDPITPGSPYCSGDCSFITDLHLDYPDIVRGIGALWPGNQTIDTWLTAYDTGKANGPTQEQIDNSIKILQPTGWSFGNPSPPPQWFPGLNLSTLAPQFHALWTALGLNPPPLNNTPIELEETSSVTALAGGPETQSKAEAIEQDPEDTPPGGSGAATLLGKGGGLTEPTGLDQGLPPSTGSETQTPSSAPSNDTVQEPGFVQRAVNRLVPHPPGTNTTTADGTTGTNATGEDITKSGEGATKSGEGATKSGEGATKTGPGGNGTSTGAHSGGGSAG